jgi:hypothetical protein
MKTRLGAPGDFAMAYIIARLVGHHVQNLFGIAEKVTQARMQSSQEEGNLLSVRMGLQADCFAGVWVKEVNATAKILEEDEIEEGLNAAAQIGDDRLQRRSQDYVVPDAFTHGSSEQASAGSGKGCWQTISAIVTRSGPTSCDARLRPLVWLFGDDATLKPDSCTWCVLSGAGWGKGHIRPHR